MHMEKQHVYYINFIIFGLTRQRTKPVRFSYSNRASQKLFKQGVSFFGCFNCDLIQMNFKVTCSLICLSRKCSNISAYLLSRQCSSTVRMQLVCLSGTKQTWLSHQKVTCPRYHRK
jgi:hypothetical protein